MSDFNTQSVNTQNENMSNHKRISPLPTSTVIRNKILASLPDIDRQHLMPRLEWAIFPIGKSLRNAGERATYVYFLDTGIASLSYVTKDGDTAALALTGAEGIIGIESILSNESMPSQSMILCAGQGYRLKASELKVAFRQSAQLRRILLRYAQALITQIQQTAVCNRHHSIEQRLCRFLLLCLDCWPSNELVLTQELIANMLGVRREGITEAARKLQNAHVIDYRRGHISILDRKGLEAQACECYAVVKKEYDRLAPQAALPTDRKSVGIELGSTIASTCASQVLTGDRICAFNTACPTACHHFRH